MWDRRIIALGVLFFAIMAFVFVFEKSETELWMGLPIASEEELREVWGDGAFYNSLENAKKILLFDGNEMPYDKATNTFYVTQDADREAFDGNFSVARDGLEAYFLSDGYETAKSAGIAEGHIYRIWVCDGDSAAICNVVLSGLPLVSVQAGDLPEKEDEAESGSGEKDSANAAEYVEGEIAVWTADDEDFGGISSRISHMECKQSASGETITCKLRTKKDADSKKVSFLSMGKHDAWKLYRVPEADETGIRMMLAYQLWNECSSLDELTAPCHFIELVLNDKYQGLCILRPRTDDDFFGLPEKEMLIQTEDVVSTETLYGKYRPANAADFGLWIQAACAYTNLFDDIVIIDDGRESLFMPGKPEYVFGSFPGRYAYLTYNSEQRVITAADNQWVDIEEAELDGEIALRWAEARDGFLSDNVFSAAVQERIDGLRRAGLAARRGIADDGTIAAFIDGVRRRYAYIDRYYEDKR
ncbi:MAG: hypothetical protein IJ682_03845 [Lachnospiraceae bacterium]|nr:hypothetical protein [Lachnospiraceae bacterium]